LSYSFIRYPGGKSKHVNKILQYTINCDFRGCYREPFVGGGSVYLQNKFRHGWINDLDKGIFELWRMVKEEPNTLIQLIEKHTPILEHNKDAFKIKKSLELWKSIKNDINGNIVPFGYRSLFLNKTCFSGLQSGGPTGGIYQTGKYNLTSRWSRKRTIQKIKEAHIKLQFCKITNEQWYVLFENIDKKSFFFCDPPYYHKGSLCYSKHFSHDDHKNLAKKILSCGARYVVTLDDCFEIRKIWTDLGCSEKLILTEEWLYSMVSSRTKNKLGKELFIVDEKSYEYVVRNKKLGNAMDY